MYRKCVSSPNSPMFMPVCNVGGYILRLLTMKSRLAMRDLTRFSASIFFRCDGLEVGFFFVFFFERKRKKKNIDYEKQLPRVISRLLFSVNVTQRIWTATIPQHYVRLNPKPCPNYFYLQPSRFELFSSK